MNGIEAAATFNHAISASGGEGGMAGHSRPVEGSEEAPPAKRARKFPADAAPEAVQGEHPADASDLIKSSEGVDSAVGKPAEGAPGRDQGRHGGSM